MKAFRVIFIALPTALFVLIPCYIIGGFAGLVWIALGAGWDLGLDYFEKVFDECKELSEKKP